MIQTPPKVPRPSPAPRVASRLVAELAERIAATPPAGRAAVLEEFWVTDARVTPVLESQGGGYGVVTFLWRDAGAAQVLLFVNRLSDERNLGASLMARVEGTDVWHLSYRMPLDWRASYAFVVAAAGTALPWLLGDQVRLRAVLDKGEPDPRNPVTSRNRAGTVQSVVTLPHAPAQRWLEPRPGAGPRGSVVAETGPGGERLWVYRPGEVPRRATPLVVVWDGEVWAGPQDLATTVDNLVADGEIPPVHIVLVDSGGVEDRWRLLGGPTEALVAHGSALLDRAAASLPVSAAPRDVVMVGQSLGGLAALRLAAALPGRIGAVLSQSASLWHESAQEELAATRLRGTSVYLEVGSEEWVLVEPHRAVAAALDATGARVRLEEYTGGHDYACWRGGIADGLRWLLGARR